MSTTVTLNATNLVGIKITDRESRVPWASLPDEIKLDSYNGIYTKFASLDNQYKNKIVENAKLYFMHKDGEIWNMTYDYYSPLNATIYAYPALESWDESTISYDNQPDTDSLQISCYNGVDYPDYGYVYGLMNAFKTTEQYYQLDRRQFTELVNYGCKVVTEFSYPTASGVALTDYDYMKHRGSANIPYIIIVFSDDTPSMAIDSCSPTSGFRAKYSANTYTWSTKTEDFSLEMPTISHAYFRYRADSSSQYTEVDCGSATSYTMPASTISTDSFQWQVSITDSNGHSSTSDWYTISTLEVLSTATIVEPKNMAIDGSSANKFEWIHTISTGTSQTKADLQYSSDGGTTWIQFATPTGSATSTTIVANTFSAGSYIWRVRTYNTDNNAGSWSDTKPFTVIAKPTVSAVTSEQNPKPKVSWQSTGQQAYRVYIDDVFDSGVLFGTDDSYTLPLYLDDGSYTVKVIVQNSYGLWSNEATAPITVSNTAGTPMVLIAYNNNDGATLEWTEVLSYAYYIVYRDDIAIAKTRTNSYKDYIALGEHSYFIRGIYASSQNYGISNTYTIDTHVDELMITDLDTYVSISIELNDSSYADLQVSDSIKNTSIYISASDYPINEVSHFKSKIINFTCAFVKGSTLEKSFRSMLGDVVCIKTQSDTSVVGNLLEQQRTENLFYVKYNCTLSQINYDEEIQL